MFCLCLFYVVRQHHETLNSAAEVILSSSITIVSCSTNVGFRNACLDCMKVRLKGYFLLINYLNIIYYLLKTVLKGKVRV